jgi:flagellar motor component MotA
MCAVSAVAALSLGTVNSLAGLIVALVSLSNPHMIGPSIAVTILSPLYAVFLAGVVIAAMWAQITRYET